MAYGQFRRAWLLVAVAMAVAACEPDPAPRVGVWGTGGAGRALPPDGSTCAPDVTSAITAQVTAASQCFEGSVHAENGGLVALLYGSPIAPCPDDTSRVWQTVQAEAQAALTGVPLPSCQFTSVGVNGGLLVEAANLDQILDACRGGPGTLFIGCGLPLFYPTATFRVDAAGRVAEVEVRMLPPPCVCNAGVCAVVADAGLLEGDAGVLDGDADTGASDAGGPNDAGPNDAGPTRDEIAACLTSAVRELSFPCNAGVKLCNYDTGLAD